MTVPPSDIVAKALEPWERGDNTESDKNRARQNRSNPLRHRGCRQSVANQVHFRITHGFGNRLLKNRMHNKWCIPEPGFRMGCGKIATPAHDLANMTEMGSFFPELS
jgi:hypothetical protein